ncbi:hypothetical protein MINTM002_40460 [Mycobacterium intracellulare]|nr:hypothetical protein MINTM002_40460 [Mycobacterium intracellulare]BCO69462.1 hypothetical protein MINTM007_40730 [Mycobacterium intracellulare]
MHRGVGQLHLRLDPAGTDDATAGGPFTDVVQQGRLADTRLSMKYQNTTLTGAHAGEKLFQRNTFRVPAYQGTTIPWRRHRVHGVENSRVVSHPLAKGCCSGARRRSR